MLFLTCLYIIPLIYGQTLYDTLDRFRFINDGLISSTDIYEYQYEQVLYTEPENATRAGYAWAEGPVRPYLYQYDPSKSKQCMANPWLNGTDLPGDDLVAEIPSTADPMNCVTLCCSYGSCSSWTYASSAPGDYLLCTKGQPCCYLKSGIPQAVVNPSLISATMTRTYPYDSPPSGIRSSIPLGGITTGSIELRGDGTFHEWTIENQSPATGTKYGRVDNALLAFRLKNLENSQVDTRLIRTHSNHELKGVSSIKYQGAYPVSKLQIIDDTVMGKVDLYAYSVFKPANLNRSITPAIMFSLNVENTNDFPVSVDFMFNAPLSAQIDQNRASSNVVNKIVSTNYSDCITLCDQNSQCAAWNWQIVDNSPTCVLYGDILYNEYLSGCVSGIKGHWSNSQNGPLILERVGSSTSSGQFALWPVLSGNKQMSVTVDNSLKNILNTFDEQGSWPTGNGIRQLGVHGAVSVSTILSPGEKTTLSIVFAWYFPHHNWLNLPLNNYYSLMYDNVIGVGQSINIDKDDSQLITILNDISTLHNIYLDSSLPDSLVDSLINSVSHVRSAMFFANGDWRQWEAYDCNDVDSVHNDHQRHLPYMVYFPLTEKIKMYAWASYQQADGMIQETFTIGCTGNTFPYDQPGGRRMGDVTSIFILETLEIYRWTNDTQFLKDMYSHIVAGLKWQLSTATEFGLPKNLECTYDIPAMSQYPTTTFNSFMHLAALGAGMELAFIMNDTATYNECYQAFTLAKKQIYNMLWYEDSIDTGYFLAYTGGHGEKAIFTDALYGQVLAYTYGIGTLYNTTLMKMHLDSEVRLADTPYGLRMLTGREPLTNPQDNSIWMGASQDWSVLKLWLGSDIDLAMSQSVKGIDHVRLTLNDQWNTHGLYAGDGYGVGGKPWTTSHYGFHMVLWHLPFAFSGQYVDLPNGILKFSPKRRTPFMLPVLIPNILGTISSTSTSDGRTQYSLSLSVGSLSLNTLAIDEVTYPGKVNLSAGQTISWLG